MAGALAIGLELGSAGNAFGNGRFPNALQLRERTGDALVVAATYGLLSTTNAGSDFAWVCESELFGHDPGGSVMDPLLELAPDGWLLTGSPQALRASRDGGCSFETVTSLPRNWSFFGMTVPAGEEGGKIIDLCRRGAGPQAPVLALVALIDADGFARGHRIYEAVNGFEFAPIGAPIPPALLPLAFTFDAAPSDPNRIYVTGSLANDPVLLVSADGGESWQSKNVDLDDAELALGAYLGGVSPSDPDRLYLRVPRRADSTDGLYTWDDSLLVSSDGGSSFADVLRRRGNLLGFALSADGESVLAGYGDPKVSMIETTPADLGIYRADGAGLVFQQIVSDLDVSCLFWSASGLYACASERDPLGADPALAPDFHLGVHRGSELPSRRGDFTPLLKLKDVRGPPLRADGTPSACSSEWRSSDPPEPADACYQFNACDEGAAVELSPGALACGQAGASGSGTSNASAGAGPLQTSPSGGGCACHGAVRVPAPSHALAALAACCLVGFGRRRARSAALRSAVS